MKLIVGLGNPGKQYLDTRHNLGFFILDEFSKSLDIKIEKEKFNSLIELININGEKHILCKPLTFMNLSGNAVSSIKNYYKIKNEDIIIIHDDIDQELGKFKLCKNSGHGGQNGVKDIIEKLGTNDFTRLKIGIGRPKNNLEVSDYVLGNLSKIEKEKINEIKPTLINLLNDFFNLNFVQLSNEYNKK